MRASATKISAVTLAGLLALTLSACGDDEEDAGSSSPVQLAKIDDLSGGISTSVKLDPAFLAGLTALKVTPGVVGPTKLNVDTLVFTITGGNVTLFEKGTTGSNPYVTGLIKHDGNGITLSAGGKKVELKNFDVDPGASILKTDVSVDGAKFADDVPTFFLDGRTLTYPPTAAGGAGTATLTGTTVSLTPEAVGALNDVFGIKDTPNALPAYFKVGVATILVKTPA